MQPLEPLFRLAEILRRSHGVAFGVSEEGTQPQINAYLLARGLMLNASRGRHRKWTRRAISPPEQPYPLDL
jgi:hypothetical protein